MENYTEHILNVSGLTLAVAKRRVLAISPDEKISLQKREHDGSTYFEAKGSAEYAVLLPLLQAPLTAEEQKEIGEQIADHQQLLGHQEVFKQLHNFSTNPSSTNAELITAIKNLSKAVSLLLRHQARELEEKKDIV